MRKQLRLGSYVVEASDEAQGAQRAARSLSDRRAGLRRARLGACSVGLRFDGR